MKILALDQATLTGWALIDGDGRRLDSGVWKLEDKNRTGESRGMRYLRLRHFLQQIFKEHPDIDLICHEQTLLRGGAATELANGFKGQILMFGAEVNVPVTCVHAPELKKWATGDGRADMDKMLNAAFSLSGWPPRDDNEADALLIGLWASSKFGAFPAPQWPSKQKRKIATSV